MQKEKKGYHNCGGKEKAAECYLKNRSVLKEKAINIIETCQKEKKKQKENMEKIDTEI